MRQAASLTRFHGPATASGAHPSAPGILSVVRRWIDTAGLDARARYLSHASDHAELERRLRAWDEHERRRSLLALLMWPP